MFLSSLHHFHTEYTKEIPFPLRLLLLFKSQSHCKTSIYILTPEYQSFPSPCPNFNKQGDIIFDDNGCGIVIDSSTWWEKKILNVTGKTDGLINAKDRDVYIRLGSGTQSKLDISGVWYNFTMPDIKVRTMNKSFMKKDIANRY